MSAKSYICVMEEHVFKQKIRWWKVAVDIFVLSVIAFSIFLMMSTGERGRTYRYGLFVLVGLSALMDLLSMFTTRYVISGDMLATVIIILLRSRVRCTQYLKWLQSQYRVMEL